MVTAGEKPGIGFYFCVQCGHRVYLEIGTDRLPPCGLEMVNPVYLFCDDCLLSILTDDEGSWAKDDFYKKSNSLTKD